MIIDNLNEYELSDALEDIPLSDSDNKTYKYETIESISEEDIINSIDKITKKDYLITYDYDRKTTMGLLSWTLFGDLISEFEKNTRISERDDFSSVNNKFVCTHIITNKNIRNIIYNNTIFQIYENTNFFRKYSGILNNFIPCELIVTHVYPYLPNPCMDFLFASDKELIFIMNDVIESHNIDENINSLELYCPETKNIFEITDFKTTYDIGQNHNIFEKKLLLIDHAHTYLYEFSIETKKLRLDTYKVKKLKFDAFNGDYHSHYTHVNKDFYVILSIGTTSCIHIYKRDTYSLYFSREMDQDKFPAISWEYSKGWIAL